MPQLFLLSEVQTVAYGHRLTQADCDDANRAICRGESWDSVWETLRIKAWKAEEAIHRRIEAPIFMEC